MVMLPVVGELITMVPTLLARLFSSRSIPVPAGCEQVIASCPPALKKYRAASPEVNVTVCVNVIAFTQAEPYVAVLDDVEPCDAAFNLFVVTVVRLVGIAERYVTIPPRTGTVTLVIDEP